MFFKSAVFAPEIEGSDQDIFPGTSSKSDNKVGCHVDGGFYLKHHKVVKV